MAQNARNAAAASPDVAGGILWAPFAGTTLPTDATTALHANFKAFGYVGEGGVEPSGEGASRKDIRAWGGDVILNVLEAKSISRVKFPLLEIFNPEVAKFVFGPGNVAVTAATASEGTKITIQDKGEEPDPGIFVFEMRYGGKRMRYVVPNGQPSLAGERSWTDTDAMGHDIELTNLPDDSGVRIYRYLENDDATG